MKQSQKATLSNVALLVGMGNVTPRSIAYITIQVCIALHCLFNSWLVILLKVRFALSSATAWRDIDINFSHSKFYSAIVDYFEVTL
jgi:hypothetical protein